MRRLRYIKIRLLWLIIDVELEVCYLVSGNCLSYDGGASRWRRWLHFKSALAERRYYYDYGVWPL